MLCYLVEPLKKQKERVGKVDSRRIDEFAQLKTILLYTTVFYSCVKKLYNYKQKFTARLLFLRFFFQDNIIHLSLVIVSTFSNKSTIFARFVYENLFTDYASRDGNFCVVVKSRVGSKS